jgi:hypothetical protein
VTIRDRISEVLSELQPGLAQLHDDYYIIGASALVLSGVAVPETADIDLLTSAEDADRLKEIWKDYRREYHPKGKQKFRSNFARFNFTLMDVEVMGDLEVFLDTSWERLKVHHFTHHQVKETVIKIPTLQEQIRILKLFNRPKDLEKVKWIEGVSHL